MFKAILHKEFLKIKYIYLALLGLLISFFAYLYFDIVKSFFSIEPHSMLWYEAVFIGNIYYDALEFLPSIFAIIIALSQFLPEVYKKKFRIPLHLPINQNKMVLFYLGVGLFLLSILNLLFIVSFYFVSNSFYNELITNSAIKNIIPWCLASYIIYNAIASIMIEPFFKRRVFLAILFILTASLLFVNDEYEAYNGVLFIYITLFVLSFFIPLLSLYRFKNGDAKLLENHTISSKLALVVIVLFSFLTLSFYFPKLYKDLVEDDSLATYVFYSSKEKKFVYKKHYGEHNFTYGDSLGNIFDAKTFEQTLPFVYWRNLDIQKKLPILIDGIVYDKRKIKKARQSFKFDYRDLKQNSIQTQLYPLFNPSSKIGTIPFPNVMFNLDKNFTLYDSEKNKIEKTLSLKYTEIFKEKDFTFPAKIIAGKTTNIKPLDEGYFILDSKDELFHMKVYDDEMTMKKIPYDKTIAIQDIKISESRKKEFYGLILDKKGEVYVISYENYKLTKLKLKNYDAKAMKLEIYANPINKLVRFQDKQNVYAIAFDKEFNYLDSYETSIPQINPIFSEISSYLFPFMIKKDEYKSYESYSFELGSYKAYLSGLFFAFVFFTFKRFRISKESFIKMFLLLFGGIYSLFFILFI